MRKRKTGRRESTTLAAGSAEIFRAAVRSDGDVIKGDRIDESQAVIDRKAGQDVVVCGDDLSANRSLAQRLEYTANGSYQRHPPHASAGPGALPHFQPRTRPPAGHTFYETPNRKAKSA